MNEGKKYNLSIVIPCYKEKNRVERCITESVHYLETCPLIDRFEIILVLDDAGDGTKDVIEELLSHDDRLSLIDNPTRLQKGYSVKEGMLRAGYELMLFYDADLSTPLYEIGHFLSRMNGYDILVASRRSKDSRVIRSRFKRFLSAGLAFVNKAFLGLSF